MCSRKALLIVAFTACVVSVAAAQTELGVIEGSVTDTSGAVLPGVEVTITNTATGSHKVIQTGAEGNYVAEDMNPGAYQVIATKAGFKETRIMGIVLQVAQRARIDIAMQLGEVSQQVDVQGSTPLLETETSSVGKVITTEDILNLPLNGREFLQLATLIPGVSKTYSPSYMETTGGSVSEDGMSNSSNNTMVDGVMNQETGAARMTFSPSIDMIQEFKMQLNSYDAEYGRTPGAQIEIVTKRGGTSYHGSAYEFLRNNDLDARPYFQPTALPPFRRNQFGGTFGGHVPKDEKDFFFVSYEGLRSTQGLTFPVTLFQPAYRPASTGGDANFSGSGTTIYDPQTGLPFPGNIIPASRLNPVTLYFMNRFIPTAGVSNAGANNFVSNPPQTYDNNQFSGRYDRDITSKDSLMGRYTRNTIVGLLPNGNSANALPLPGLGEDITLYGYNVAVRETHTFNTSMLNTATFGFSQYNQQRHNQTTNQHIIPDSGLQGVQDVEAGIPEFSISGYTTFTDNYVSPVSQPFDNYVFQDTFAKVWGNHSLRVGFDFLYSRTTSYLNLFDRGSLTFGPYYTTPTATAIGNEYNAYADWLLGIPVSSSIWLKPVITDWRSHTVSEFFQDDWRVSKRLSLNLGLRYDLYTPAFDTQNRMTALALPQGVNVYAGSIPTLPGTPPGSVLASSLGYPRNLDFPTTHNNFSPRFGFAWKLPHNENTVLRGGAAVFYNWLVIDSATDLSTGPPWVPNTSINCTQTTPCLNATDPFTTNILAVPASNVANKTNRTPYTIQYSLGIQHEFTPTLGLEVNYVGNTGFKNYVPLNVNQPAPGPGSNNSRAPYPAFGSLSNVLSIGKSHYDSLQASLTKTYDATGLVFLASYTWSHALGNSVSGPQFEENGSDSAAGVRYFKCLECEYGNTPYDIRQIFSLSASYALPFGKGKLLARSANSVVDGFIGGWSTQAIVSLTTGNYITPLDSVNVSNSGNTRPDVTCNPNNGVSHSNRSQSVLEWFNTACFAQPAQYTFGTSGVGIIETPGYADFDLAFQKRFVLMEHLGLQIRGELFNAFNHTNLGAPSVSAFGTPTFGTINSIVGTARDIQLGARLDF
jgi:hypothetical protein